MASLLELAEANPYSARAYRRAAETIRATRWTSPSSCAGRCTRAPRIGSGIESRLRELVETGQIAELGELEHELAPDLVGLGRYPRPQCQALRRARPIVRTCGPRPNCAKRRPPAAATVPGIGPKTEARLLEALAARMSHGRARGCCSAAHGARRRRCGGARRRGGGRRAPLARHAEQLSVVCAAPAPGRGARALCALPQIVRLLERDDHRAVGLTIEGVPLELLVAESERFGAELVRATGRRRTSPRSSRCPTRPTRSACTRRSPALVPAGAPRGAVRAASRPRLSSPRDPRRPALPQHLVGWTGEHRGDGPGGRAARLRVPGDLRSHAGGGRRPGLAPDDVRRQGEEIAAVNELLAPFRSCAGSSATSFPTASSTFLTTSSPSSTGSRQASTAGSGCHARR